MDISKELADILDFYSLLCENPVELHKDLIAHIEKIKNEAYEEGANDFESFKANPFGEDFELAERIGNQQAYHLFKDCETINDFQSVVLQLVISNCIAMPVLGLTKKDN